MQESDSLPKEETAHPARGRPPRSETPSYIGNQDQKDHDSDHGHLHDYHSNSNSNNSMDSKAQRHHRRHHGRQRNRSRVPVATATATAPTGAGEEDSSASQQRHRKIWRDAWAQSEGQRQWSPWSRWRVILKLLYAVAVPAVIIYLLLQVENSLQGRDGAVTPTVRASWREGTRPWPPPSEVGTGTAPEQRSWMAFLGSRRHRHRHRHEHGHDHDHDHGHGHGDGPRGDESSPSGWPFDSHLHPGTDSHQLGQQQNMQLRGSGSTMVQQTFFDSFLLFGDSITQFSFNVNDRGFGAQLANLFQRRLDLINRGFSGYTSEQAIHLLSQFLPRTPPEPSPQTPPKIQFLTIFFGANDASLPPSPQHVDIGRYGHNLRTLINMVHSPDSPTYSPETKIIVICPPPVDEVRWAANHEGQVTYKDKDLTRQYAERCLSIGQEYAAKNSQQRSPRHCQVDVIDTWGIMMKRVESGQGSLDDYLLDGVHLAAEGNNLVFEQIADVMKNRYPEWDPETMPMNAPYWRNLDLKNPEADLLVCANKVKP